LVQRTTPVGILLGLPRSLHRHYQQQKDRGKALRLLLSLEQNAGLSSQMKASIFHG
jgi:hypothetical protein